MIDLETAIEGLPPDQQIGVITEYALHSLEIARIEAAGERHGRGLVVPLTSDQRVARALYLAQERPLASLDGFVRRSGAPVFCPDLYYRLKDHNGGKDPTAPDPADRWSREGSTFENRTADCIGGAAWIGGWDRYQPVRFAHLYGGWINTDSMLMDARGPRRCFHTIPDPEPGCYVVCSSGSRGHRIGHIGTVVWVPRDWHPDLRSCWYGLVVVDVADRRGCANARTTGVGWYGADASFVVPVMTA